MSVFRKAIAERRVVKIRYDDDAVERDFAPHIIYVSTLQKETIAGRQIRNPAEPMETNEWRNMTLAKFRTVRLTDVAFNPEPLFNPLDKRYGTQTIVHVKQDIR